MSPYFRSPALLFFGSPAYKRYATAGLVGFLILAAGMLLASRAGAQNVPMPTGITCVEGCRSGSSNSSGETDEERQARRQAQAEAREIRNAERDKQKAIKDAQKLADKQAKDEARRQALQEIEDKKQAAIDAQRRQEEAQRQQAAEAERQRLLAVEAERLQAAFNAAKPGVVSDLKGVDGAPAGGSGYGLGLKDSDDGQRGGSQAAWAATITDPQVAPIARHLASFVPPMPISEKDVALDWKKIYLNDNRLLDATDYVVAGWQMAGMMGKVSTAEVEVALIVGKTLIAGQDGAYMYLARRDKEFDAAAAYLKNPATAQAFAHLVDDVRQNRPLPSRADPAMVEAAQAINAHHAGNDIEGKKAIVPIAWDLMTSPEALSAMLRKASIEGSAAILSHGMEPGINKLLEGQAQRKAVYDGIQMERNTARKMMDLPATTGAQREQLTTLIKKANQLSADCYKFETVDRVVNTANGLALGDATDKIAKALLGPETKVHEF